MGKDYEDGTIDGSFACAGEMEDALALAKAPRRRGKCERLVDHRLDATPAV
jgi:hypothetical protein